MNGDLRLNAQNNYFTYRFPLASRDTSLVITNVIEDFPGIDADNGWRLIRIPLGEDFEFARTGTPDFTQIRHVRLWMTNVRKPANRPGTPIQLSSVEFVGNKWLTGPPTAPILNGSGEPATDAELATGETFAVSVVNNKDNGDVYEPAFELERDRDSAGDEFEAYLSLDLLNFPANHTGTCFRRFAQDQDYTLYETVEFFTQIGRPVAGSTELEFFIRFGSSDGNNYYEYRRTVRSGAWELIEIPLAELSTLKQNLESGVSFVKVPRDDRSWLIMKGRPSFTRVRQITMGVTNTSGGFIRSASVWVNELRLDDVERNASTASEFRLSTKLSDLGSFSFDWKGRDADFITVGQSRGLGVNERNINHSTTINADRFVPRLQMRVPVSYSYSRNTREPKFQTGSDVVFEGENRDLNVSRTVRQNFRVSYSRTPSTNPLLRYTIDGFSASYGYDRTRRQTPTQTDSTSSWTGTLGYSFATPQHPLIGLPFGIKMDYLPNQIGASGSVANTSTTVWQRPSSDLTQPLEFQSDDENRTAALNWNTSYRVLTQPNVNYTFSSSRDLIKDGLDVGGVNLGVETSRQESVTASHSISPISDDFGKRYPLLGELLAGVVNTFVAPLRPSINWSSRFSARIDQSRAAQDADLEPQTVSNSANTVYRATFPVNALLRSLKEATTQSGPKPAPEPDEDAPPDEDEEEGEEAGPKRGGGRRGQAPPGTPGEATEGEAPSEPSGPSSFGARLLFTDIIGQFTQTRSSSNSFINAMPSLGYQLGFTRDIGNDAQPLPTNRGQLTNTDAFNLSTGLKLRDVRVAGQSLGGNYDFKLNYSRDDTRTEASSLTANGVPNPPTLVLTERTSWPDVQFTANNIHEGMGFLEERVRRLTLNSRYQRSENISGDHDVVRRNEQVRKDWTPFVSVEATLRSGMRLTFRSNKSATETVRSGTIRTVTESDNSDVSFSLQHTLERKKKIKIGSSTQILSTRIDFALNFALERRTDRTVSATGNVDTRIDRRTLRLGADAGYNFTRNIDGQAKIEFTEAKDLKTASNTSKAITVTITATFRF